MLDTQAWVVIAWITNYIDAQYDVKISIANKKKNRWLCEHKNLLDRICKLFPI